MKQKQNKLDVWMVSRISANLGKGIDCEMDGIVVWSSDFGTVELDQTKKEIRMVDWCGDDKTYYSVIGVATISGFDWHDCYSE